MDPEEYKTLCARPDVLRRSALEDTARALRSVRSPDTPLVEEILEQPPVEKPVVHSAGSEADFFYVTLERDVAGSVLETLLDAEQAAARRTAITFDKTRLTELIDLWTRYREWLENGGAA